MAKGQMRSNREKKKPKAEKNKKKGAQAASPFTPNAPHRKRLRRQEILTDFCHRALRRRDREMAPRDKAAGHRPRGGQKSVVPSS